MSVRALLSMAALVTLLAVPVAAQDSSVTPAVLTLGENVFKGKAAGGTCFTCHQASGKGLPGLAPDLTDKTWLHGDGSLASIVSTIEKGIPKPKQAAVAMLPKGGANLTSDQVHAVAAYVYSLSHPK